MNQELIYLNEKQANELLGDHLGPADIEFYDGFPASASWAKMHEGLYIIIYKGDENEG